MNQLGSQRDYWNARADTWSSMQEPLIPDQNELDFVRKHLPEAGDTLILGATPQLCELALGASATVTAVDYAQSVIQGLRRQGVRYHCADWSDFFDGNDDTYDTILTDGGLLCLEFPGAWQRIAGQIHDHLRPGGKFVARVYINTEEPPKETYANPNLRRFVTSMDDVDDNWMVHPKHEAYADYDMYYTFPPEHEVLRKFGRLALLDKFVPTYEEGERFVSYAWQRQSGL